MSTTPTLPPASRVAFKEWAVICRALAVGRQAVILRKGGISEAAGVGAFEVEHRRFWLFPTYVHQQAAGIVPSALGLLQQAEAERPPDDRVRIQHLAVVERIYQVQDLLQALRLIGQHVWSDETIEQRFHYRRPGLFALPIRVFSLPAAHLVPSAPAYAGCKTWVELDEPLSTAGAEPVLSDAEFADAVRRIDEAIHRPQRV